MKNKHIETAYLVTEKTDIALLIKKKSITRWYIGDQECDFNLLAIMKKIFFWLALSSWKKITLLLPKFSGNNLAPFLEYLEQRKNIWNKIPKAEFSINDYWLIPYIQKIIPNAIFVNGAYIAHQQRDAQLPDDATIIEKKNGLIKWDFPEYNSFMKEKNIVSLDVFNTKHKIIIEHLTQPVNLFYPYIIVWFSRYCYAYNMSQGNAQVEIAKNCSGCSGKDTVFKGNIGGTLHYYKGNKYFYSCFTRKNLYNPNLDIQRIIYNYDIK